jgi:hypothetical protein
MRRTLPKRQKLQAQFRQQLLSEGLLQAFHEAMREPLPEGYSDMAPGFNLLDRWLLDHPVSLLNVAELDEDDLVNLYEGLIDRKLAQPGQKTLWAANLLEPTGLADFFPRPLSNAEWYAPAALIIALVAACTEEAIKFSGDLIELRTPRFRYSIAPRRVWSNLRDRYETPAVAAASASLRTLDVPGLVTSHPALRALVKLRASRKAFWMLRLLLDVCDLPADPVKVVGPLPSGGAGGRRIARRWRVHHGVSREEAIEEMLHLVTVNARGCVPEIYMRLKRGFATAGEARGVIGRHVNIELDAKPLSRIAQARVIEYLQDLKNLKNRENQHEHD